MATCNFKTQDYGLPLVVFETDEAYYEVEIEDVEQAIDELDLRYFHVKIKGGHYNGIQIDVSEDNYIGYDTLDELTDDEADYFYGKRASVVRREMMGELKKIKRFMRMLKDRGWLELELQGVFSNGEGVYKIVE